MKKIIIFIVSVFLFAACEKPQEAMLKLSTNTLQLTIGEMDVLEVEPNDAGVEWTSSDANVAAVSDGMSSVAKVRPSP